MGYYGGFFGEQAAPTAPTGEPGPDALTLTSRARIPNGSIEQITMGATRAGATVDLTLYGSVRVGLSYTDAAPPASWLPVAIGSETATDTATLSTSALGVLAPGARYLWANIDGELLLVSVPGTGGVIEFY